MPQGVAWSTLVCMQCLAGGCQTQHPPCWLRIRNAGGVLRWLCLGQLQQPCHRRAAAASHTGCACPQAVCRGVWWAASASGLTRVMYGLQEEQAACALLSVPRKRRCRRLVCQNIHVASRCLEVTGSWVSWCLCVTCVVHCHWGEGWQENMGTLRCEGFTPPHS